MELPDKLGSMVRWRRRNWGRSMACCDGDRRVAARQHGLWRTRLRVNAPLRSRTTRLEDHLLPLRRHVDTLNAVIVNQEFLLFVRRLSGDAVHKSRKFQAVVISPLAQDALVGIWSRRRPCWSASHGTTAPKVVRLEHHVRHSWNHSSSARNPNKVWLSLDKSFF